MIWGYSPISRNPYMSTTAFHKAWKSVLVGSFARILHPPRLVLEAQAPADFGDQGPPTHCRSGSCSAAPNFLLTCTARKQWSNLSP